jgi:outer membrane protein TolC
VFIPLLVLTLAQTQVAQATPSPHPSPAPTPIATASPNLIALPRATGGLTLPAVPAIGPTFLPGSVATPSGEIAGTTGPFVGITLDDAVAMALARDTDLTVSQSNRRIAAYNIVAAKGAYDLNFELQPKYSLEKDASISSFEAGPGGGPVQTITEGASGGFTGNTASGGKYQISTTAQRVDSNNTIDSYEPYYQTALALQFTQPLARGRNIDANRRQLQLARINADLSDDNALVTASSAVDNVLVAYYNLVAAWKSVAIQEDALLAAKAQSESNARLVRRGQSAPVDVVESDTQVDEFQDDVYSAIANVAMLQNSLKQLILSDPADPIWTANLVPTSPVTTQIDEPKVDDLVAQALAKRPEVAQLRENMREENVNVAYQKDQTKPQIDLNVGITEQGFAGAPTDPAANPIASVIGGEITSINQLIARSNANNPGLAPLSPLSGSALDLPLYPGTVGKLGASYGTALAGKFPIYSIGATIGFPLQNRTAKANLQAELERRSSLQTQEVALIQRVQYEARNAVQQYRSARSSLIAATAARVAAEQVAQSELRKFRVGQSTTFLVLQREVTLANERNRELQAQSNVQKALVEIDRVSGAILANNNVDVKTLGTGPKAQVPSLLLSH